MNFKKLLSCFCVGTVLCVAARIFQIVYATEYSTGFFARGKENLGWAMLGVIGVVCLVLAIISFKAYKNPEKPPRTRVALSVTAILVAVALIYEIVAQNMPLTMPAWQVMAVKFVTVLCMFYFVAFAVQGFTEFKMPALCHAIPCVYAIVKTIGTFINISSIPVISDNILLVAGYCLLMLFFINFGKLYNRIDGERGFRKLLGSGMATAIVCLTQSLSVIVINIVNKNAYLHADLAVMGSLLAMGLFVTVFIYQHFSKAEKEEHI